MLKSRSSKASQESGVTDLGLDERRTPETAPPHPPVRLELEALEGPTEASDNHDRLVPLKSEAEPVTDPVLPVSPP